MRSRTLLLAGLFLVSGCAYGVGDDYGGTVYSSTGYRPVEYASPYMPGSPVYGAPYAQGWVMGGIYAYGDEDDRYGGPLFSPYHGIRCDRRRQACWDRNGLDPRWSARFFGRRNAPWGNGHWQNGNWQNGNWQNGSGQNGAPNNSNRPWVYRVPKNPDGSGAPTFLPNGCGGNGRPPCN